MELDQPSKKSSKEKKEKSDKDKSKSKDKKKSNDKDKFKSDFSVAERDTLLEEIRKLKLENGSDGMQELRYLKTKVFHYEALVAKLES